MSALEDRPAAPIAAIAASLLPVRRTSLAVEALTEANSPETTVPAGIVESVTGIRERRVTPEGVFASDLATDAAGDVARRVPPIVCSAAMHEPVMGDAHSPICPKRSPSTAHAACAVQPIATCALSSMLHTVCRRADVDDSR